MFRHNTAQLHSTLLRRYIVWMNGFQWMYVLARAACAKSIIARPCFAGHKNVFEYRTGKSIGINWYSDQVTCLILTISIHSAHSPHSIELHNYKRDTTKYRQNHCTVCISDCVLTSYHHAYHVGCSDNWTNEYQSVLQMIWFCISMLASASATMPRCAYIVLISNVVESFNRLHFSMSATHALCVAQYNMNVQHWWGNSHRYSFCKHMPGPESLQPNQII